MFKRPRRDEDEDEILRMQEEFLTEKSKNKDLKPAASVVNLRKPNAPSQSTSTSISIRDRKQSKYAELKGLSKKSTQTKLGNSVVGDIVEKNVVESISQQDDNLNFTQFIPSLVGNIVEKNVENFEYKPYSMPYSGFPEPIQRTENSLTSLKSILTQPDNREITVNSPDNLPNQIPDISTSDNFPSKSYMLSSSHEAEKIHKENLQIICQMSRQQIEGEKEQLISTLDPKIVEFIRSKRAKTTHHVIEAETSNANDIEMEDLAETKAPKSNQEMSEQSDFATDADYWDGDVLSHPDVNKWLHFDSLEKDKLEWIKGIKMSNTINPDEPYEARFNFKGYLLPYSIEYNDKTKTLFHHGDEPHRPGYTLNELFELSRSAVVQQRAVALQTLAGIMEYYSTGVYKGVIDIPLTKIFFVIRFSMDENKEIILEPALKAMRNLLYNRIDEACLDALLGFKDGLTQPSLYKDKSDITEMDSDESELKDFHLAEVDLINGAIRTDMLPRIRYILSTLKLSFNCVNYCLQILTRLARDSEITAVKILNTENLLECIVGSFLPDTGLNFTFNPLIVYQKPMLSGMKLVRILLSQSKEIAKYATERCNLLAPLSAYVTSVIDSSYGLRLQTESFYIWTYLLLYGSGGERLKNVTHVLVGMFHKIEQSLNLTTAATSFAIAHASSLINLLTVATQLKLTESIVHNYRDMLIEGLTKWSNQFLRSSDFSCGQLRLFSSALDAIVGLVQAKHMDIKVMATLVNSILCSNSFNIILKHLVPSSNLLSRINSANLHFITNLVGLSCSIIDSNQKIPPVLSHHSPIPFLLSLTSAVECLPGITNKNMLIHKLWGYITKLHEKSMLNLSDHWFSRIEIKLLTSIVRICCNTDLEEGDKDVMYAVSNKLCYTLRSDMKSDLDFIFTNAIFNKGWYTTERLLRCISISESDMFSSALSSIDSILKCYASSMNLNVNTSNSSLTITDWAQPILPRDWVYLPIVSLYIKSQEIDNSPQVMGDHANKVDQLKQLEKETTVRICLQWILFSELCFPEQMNEIDITDRFCRIMCVFLCDNSLFLDGKIKPILGRCVKALYDAEKMKPLNFDRDLAGVNNFQDLYTQFVEQFQAVSYGDPVFASCVLVPLAQKHDPKWRKLVWSEYAGCLRALDCSDDLLCYRLDDYLYPEEKDQSLLFSYSRALSSNILRPDSIPYRIAMHHLTCAKDRAKTLK